MRWSCAALVAVAGAGSAVTADAAAGVVVSSALRSACEQWRDDAAVFACDPRGEGRRITLTLGRERVSRRVQHRALGDGRLVGGASLHIGGDEPLQPGETVVLDWPTPSAQAELAVQVLTDDGVRTAVLRLSWRPRHVAVTVRPDGSLEVRSPGRTDVVPAPGPSPPESSFWQGRSAREAAERVLWVIDHLADRGRRGAVLHTLCAGLHPDVYAFYGGAHQLRGVDDPTGRRRSCSEEVWSHIKGMDEALRSSRHHGHTLRIRGRRAVLRTRIVHRYDVGVYLPGSVSSRIVIPARVLLTRDPDGIWRLASFRAIGSAIPAEIYPKTRESYDDRSLERWYQHQRRWAARNQAAYDRGQADRRAAQTRAETGQPCSPDWRVDAGGDVEVVGMREQLTRRPLEHLDVDLSAAGFDGQCLGVRTAGPLPSRFKVFVSVSDGEGDGDGDGDAGDPSQYHVDVDRDQRTVYATRGTFDEGTVAGIQASVSDHEVVVRFAQAVPVRPGPVYLGIEASPLGIGFVDALRLG